MKNINYFNNMYFLHTFLIKLIKNNKNFDIFKKYMVLLYVNCTN